MYLVERRLANDHGHDHIFEIDFQRLNGRLIDYGRPGWSSRIRALKWAIWKQNLLTFDWDIHIIKRNLKTHMKEINQKKTWAGTFGIMFHLQF